MGAKVVTGLNGETMRAILDDMRPEEQQDGDMSRLEALEYMAEGVERGDVALKKLVAAGRIKKIRGRLKNGRLGYFYRPVKGE